MLEKKSFDAAQYEIILELVALIAWKIELQELQQNSKKQKLAMNTLVSVAENFAFKPFEKALQADIKGYFSVLLADKDRVEKFNRTKSVRPLLEKVLAMVSEKANESELRIFKEFLYRFAYRLSEVSGEEFAGLGKGLDAVEAEVLIEIRDLLKN